ncbi:MAG: response regulator [Elusimicrobia bacterium]|nr:response regulator [Elusimicrobiota bacterium]
MASLLIVDDDPDLLVLLEAHYGNRGHSVTSALTCEEAMHLAVAAPPDVLITDFCLPRIDGARLLRFLRDDPATRGLPVIVISAASNSWIRQRLPDDPLVRFVEKPFEFAELDGALDEMLVRLPR